MMTQKEFFNSEACSWDEKCRHDMEKVAKILDLVQIEKGSRVLDVGTGTGVLIPSLSKRVTETGQVKAIDVAENMIEIAQQKNPYGNVLFRCEEALADSGNEEPFDHIHCYSMFPHFKNKKEANEKLSTKLKVGGKLTICHSQNQDAINNLHKQKNEAVKEDNLPTKAAFVRLFHSTGLQTVSTVDNDEMFVMIATKTEFDPEIEK